MQQLSALEKRTKVQVDPILPPSGSKRGSFQQALSGLRFQDDIGYIEAVCTRTTRFEESGIPLVSLCSVFRACKFVSTPTTRYLYNRQHVVLLNKRVLQYARKWYSEARYPQSLSPYSPGAHFSANQWSFSIQIDRIGSRHAKYALLQPESRDKRSDQMLVLPQV